MADGSTPRVANINVGLLGHVDSGKTSLAKALSQVASTASLDKNPQSKERGITLDLGFSAFTVDAPPRFAPAEQLQVTLVDCPGHASLIKTIIGGAQIIDMMVLVVDGVAGFQTQTAECLVIGQVLAEKLLVVVNKIDLYKDDVRDAKVAKMVKRIRKTLSNTKFADADIVPVSASASLNIDGLVATIVDSAPLKPRSTDPERFLFSVDHCFAIKGQGTVVTGTVQSGSVSVGQTVEFPSLGLTKRVKSMQMYRNPIDYAKQGDRLGICVAQLNAKLLERGLVCAPGSISALNAAVVSITRIPYYRGDIESRSKFHVTVGHETVMATVYFFRSIGADDAQLVIDQGLAGGSSGGAVSGAGPSSSGNVDPVPEPEPDAASSFSYESEYLILPELDNADTYPADVSTFAVLEFESPILCAPDAMLIGSKLDAEVDANVCRLAFSGQLVAPFDTSARHTLRAFRPKSKTGSFARIKDERNVICKGLFPKHTDPAVYTGLRVVSSHNGAVGVIKSRFGASNKINVFFADGGQDDPKATITLHHRKYLFEDPADTRPFIQ